MESGAESGAGADRDRELNRLVCGRHVNDDRIHSVPKKAKPREFSSNKFYVKQSAIPDPAGEPSAAHAQSNTRNVKPVAGRRRRRREINHIGKVERSLRGRDRRHPTDGRANTGGL